jgi:YVTN family beta-propeller protein
MMTERQSSNPRAPLLSRLLFLWEARQLWSALLAFALCALTTHAATFGRVVPLTGGASDLVLDEAHSRVYLVGSVLSQVQVYSLQRQSFQTTIATDKTPLSAALSRDGNSLYVACYDASTLDVIDLNALSVTVKVKLPGKPEGIAVGGDGRVLISTTGSGTSGGSSVLLLYNPAPNAVQLTAIPVAPAAPTPPTFPPPSGRPFLANHSQLVASRDGRRLSE